MPNVARFASGEIEIFDKLTDDGFYRAAGSEEALNPRRGSGIWHITAQRGLEIDPIARQPHLFRLRKQSLIANQ